MSDLCSCYHGSILTIAALGTSDSIVAFEGHAIAAANWIIVCGRQLYNECIGIRTEFTTLQANIAWVLEREDLSNDVKKTLQEAKIAMDGISV